MGQTKTVGKHATTVEYTDGVLRVTYWSTAVVIVDGDYVTLRSGGWHTATTKARMNQASSQFDLGYRVFQKDYEWFLAMPNGDIVRYWDGITFPRLGAAASARPAWEVMYQALPYRSALQAAAPTARG